MTIKVEQLRKILNEALENLEDYFKDEEIITSPNTFKIGDHFIAMGSNGYLTLDNSEWQIKEGK